MVSLINYTSRLSGRTLDDYYPSLLPVPWTSLPDITGQDIYSDEDIAEFPQGYEIEKGITPSLKPGDSNII